MRIAIMQPYFVPYIGYFQLISAVDKFVVLDDVNYIKRGWINRNRIGIRGEPSWLTLPLSGASQNKLISELDVLSDEEWKTKALETFRVYYTHAPNREVALSSVTETLQAANGNLSEFLVRSLTAILSLLSIKTTVVPSSRIFPKEDLRGQDRILDICLREGADTYINPPGGREIYSLDLFAEAGVKLAFLKPDPCQHMLVQGFSFDEFGSSSIIDLLFHNSIESLSDAVRRGAIGV